MTYKVETNLNDDKFSGTFTFPTLELAALKVFNSVDSCMSVLGIEHNLINNGVNKGEAVTIWCEDERLSYCKVMPI